jgi:5-methylcytosine-specific restriction protein A
VKPTPRLRGRKLQQRRARYLFAHPLCRMCESQNIVRAATVIDHIMPLHKGGADTEDNWQPLDDECHRIKSAADAGKRATVARGLDGWPL